MKILKTEHGTSNTEHATWSTQHGARNPHYAIRVPCCVFRVARTTCLKAGHAFTLIELLVVIAIIAILASLVIPIGRAVNRHKIRSKVRGELAAVELAVESYKAKMGHYPPDNPDNPRLNPLYFELAGTIFTNNAYQTLDGAGRIIAVDLPMAFGPKVTGLINATQPSASDEARTATRFLRDLKPGQVGLLKTNAVDRANILLCSVPWPIDPNYPIAGHPGMNPVRYNSSSPTNNPNSFDLWIDVVIDGKTNRFSNWSKEPLIVNTPW